MIRWLPMIACLTFAACRPGMGGGACGRPAGARAEVWVEAGRGGDGSAARPFGALGEALEEAGRGPLRVNLAPGRYGGPFVLPPGVELVGAGEGTVLVGEGEGAVVRAPRGARVKGVRVEGGTWGLEAEGEVGLEAVCFGGQMAGALRLEAGRLEAVGCGFEAGAPGGVGLSLGEATRAWVRESTFQGAWRRGVESRGAEVELEAVRFVGALTALHQARGQGRLRHVEVGEGPEVGLFVNAGSLRLEDVTVTGHEYGLQTLEATLEVRGFTSVRAARAGVALVGSHGDLEAVRVRGSGGFGAVSLLGSDVTLRDTRVEDADAYGVVATRGRLRLERAELTGLTSRDGDSGDGLHLRDVEVEAWGLVVRGAAGSGVLAAQGAQVVLHDASLEACGAAGLWVETLARVRAGHLEIRGSKGPALVALEDGVLRVDTLSARDNAQGVVMADCQGGTDVTLGPVTGSRAAASPCVHAASP